MIRSIISILIIYSGTMASAQQVSLNTARETYFGMRVDECNALRLSDNFEKSPPANAVLKAYYGAASAAAPACLGNPAKKIAYFRKGKQLLADAVRLQPDNFEIRFLRFATQSKTPSFLGYDQHIGEDKRFLLANLDNGRKTVSNERIFGMILNFMATSEHLNKAEQDMIRRLTNT